MKKRSTRFLSLLLSLLMLISVFPAGTMTAQAADYNYNPSAAIAYAQKHWNDGVGLCAQFVSNCLAAGGFNKVWNTYAATLGQQLQRYGTKIDCHTKPGQVIRAADFAGKLTPGDVIIWEGSSKRASGHATLYYRTDGKGKIRVYQHNRALADSPSIRDSGSRVCYAIHLSSAQSQPTPPAPPAIPDKPTITGISATDIAVGKSVTITWNGSARATAYNVAVRGAENHDLGTDANARSYTLTLSKVGTYAIYVEAKNQSGTSSNNNSRTCTAHANSTVRFVDWDGKELHTQSVRYGESATAPASPTRKGYTFQGWSDSFYNVTANRTIRANYKINTYTVNFLDKEKKVLKSEKVEYGKNATPPTDVNVPTGYIFVGWQSQDYKSVYTDATNKTINVQGIYE